MMKQSHLTVFLIFSLLIFLLCFHSDARFLAGEVQGSTVDKKVNYDEEIVNEESFITATKDDILDLMGSKVCDYKDEECLKRRMIAEAHLDYIYTQQHKP